MPAPPATDQETMILPDGDLRLAAVDMGLPDEELVPRVHEQLSTVGFLLIHNCGPAYDEGELFDHVQKFHTAVPEHEKRKLWWRNHNRENENRFRGLAPVVDNDQSHKELFDMGVPYDQVSEAERRFPLVEETPFPLQGEAEFVELRKYFEAQFEHRLQLGLRLARLIALGLGQPPDLFRPWFERDSLSTFRTIFYPSRDQASVRQDQLSADELLLTTPAHSDSGFLTLLCTFGYPGLQVWYKDAWRGIAPCGLENTLVVNLGDTLSRITNFQLKATKHRVLEIGRTRYSQPFFFDPKYSQVIPSDLIARLPADMAKDEAGRAESESRGARAGGPAINNDFDAEAAGTVVYGEWLVQKLKAAYAEWRNADF